MKAKKESRLGACCVDCGIKADSILALSSGAGRRLRQTEHEAVKEVIIAELELMVMMRCGGAIGVINYEFTRSTRNKPKRRASWRHGQGARERESKLVEAREKTVK